MSDILTKVLGLIKSKFNDGSGVMINQTFLDLPFVSVIPSMLGEFLLFLRDDIDIGCTQLIDLFGMDNLDNERRFSVVYNLLSMRHNFRLIVKVHVAEEESVPSMVNIHPCAEWFEREVWDMYGVMFSGSKDLRRILTDYGFNGHPLRKDFPLTGHVELRYDMEEKRVKYSKVDLSQEFRDFDFLSPWEGTKYIKDEIKG